MKKKRKASDADPSHLHLERREGKGDQAVMAEAAVRPTVQAALTIAEYGKKFGDLSLTHLVDALTAQTNATINGDLRRAEAMLTAQAHTLDTLFNYLSRKAMSSEYLSQFEAYLKLAMRSQAQCRATWEAVSAIKNPPMAGYVNQANIAHGPQQVNNASRTRENETEPSKLLEDTDHEPNQWLDGGASAKAERADPAVEAVGEIDRTE